MTKKLKPTYIYDRIDKIPLELLKRENIKGIFLDVDNTIMDCGGYILDEVSEWILEVKKSGIMICILSNTFNDKKVQFLRKKYDIFGIGCAKKPLLKGFKIAQNILGLEKEKLVIIGDQLFSDVLGGNRFGIKTIYTIPLNTKENIFTKSRRPLEKWILRRINK